jgi:hypothetical protein
MKTLIVLLAFFTTVAQAQIVVQTQEAHEVDMPRLTVNPFPASHWDKKRANIRPRQRTIIIVPTTQVIQTGPLTTQDQQLIQLIK